MVVLPACSFPPTVLVGLLVQPCDALEQKWIQLGKKKKPKPKTQQQRREGGKPLPDPFSDAVPPVTSPGMPGAGMSGLDEEGRGCLSQFLSSTDSAVKLLPPLLAGLKALTLRAQPWLTQLHLFANTKPSFALLAPRERQLCKKKKHIY